MRLSRLFTDERAMSSVIGAVLLVALAVILAAVVGTYVLGVGTTNAEVGPSVSFAFESKDTYVGNDGPGDTDNDGFRITHQNGEALTLSNVGIVVDGTDLLNDSGGVDHASLALVQPGTGDAEAPDGPWSANGQYVIVEDSDANPDLIQDGDEVRVVWVSPDTGQSATIFKRTVDL